MTDDLDHLTEEERKSVLEIYPKEIKDLESSNDGSHTDPTKEVEKKPEDDTLKTEWKDGYLDYEVKTKESERVSYEDDEIDVIEEDI